MGGRRPEPHPRRGGFATRDGEDDSVDINVIPPTATAAAVKQSATIE